MTVSSAQNQLRALALSLYVPAIMVTIGNGILVPILPLYAAGFEISYSLIGLILAGEAIGTLLADVPTGMIQRQLGNKQVMIIGFVVSIISVLLLLFVAESIWIVFLLTVVSRSRQSHVWRIHAYLHRQQCRSLPAW